MLAARHARPPTERAIIFLQVFQLGQPSCLAHIKRVSIVERSQATHVVGLVLGIVCPRRFAEQDVLHLFIVSQRALQVFISVQLPLLYRLLYGRRQRH